MRGSTAYDFPVQRGSWLAPPFAKGFDVDRYLEAQRFCRLLTEAGYPTMLAGGCVRDRLLGVEPLDYDLATAAAPETCASLLKQWGWRVVPVGVAYGTILLVAETQNIEITTLRSDVACYGRKAEVVFSESFEEDARRRDFTINAMFEDMDGQIRDFVGGLDDLRAKRLRFVGDPERRVREDYLRILRYFRFLSRLGWVAEDEALTVVRRYAPKLASLSAERVYGEMTRLLTAPAAADALALMARSEALAALWPWTRASALPSLASVLNAFPERDRTLCWFSFFYWGGEPMTEPDLRAEVRRLRFTRFEAAAVMALRRLFEARERQVESLFAALRLLERRWVEPKPLRAFCLGCQRAVGARFPPLLFELIDGFGRGKPPKPPREAILQAPVKERNHAVELAKIYWFSGLCRDTTQMAEIVRRPDFFEDALRSRQRGSRLPAFIGESAHASEKTIAKD